MKERKERRSGDKFYCDISCMRAGVWSVLFSVLWSPSRTTVPVKRMNGLVNYGCVLRYDTSEWPKIKDRETGRGKEAEVQLHRDSVQMAG